MKKNNKTKIIVKQNINVDNIDEEEIRLCTDKQRLYIILFCSLEFAWK